MPEDFPRTVYFTEQLCPRCGSRLCSNGALSWCSGDHLPARSAPCLFGIDENVASDDPRILPAPEAQP